MSGQIKAPMFRRPTEEELETRMVKELANAIYPILIPVEEQDCAIQADNRRLIETIALLAWREFRNAKT